MIEQAVVWRGSPSQWVMVRPYTVIVLFLLVMGGLAAAGVLDALFNSTLPVLGPYSAFLKTAIFLLPLTYGLWLWITIKFHIYELTEEVFREHYGILNRSTDELELYRINDTKTFKPFELNVLGMGNVILHTSDASDPEVIIAAVKNPDQIRQMVRHYVEVQRARKGIVEVANR